MSKRWYRRPGRFETKIIMLRPHTTASGARSPLAGPASADRCGCRVSARFLTVALFGSTVWYGSQCLAFALPLRAGVLHVLIISMAAATVGKAGGILRFRLRARP